MTTAETICALLDEDVYRCAACDGVHAADQCKEAARYESDAVCADDGPIEGYDY